MAFPAEAEGENREERQRVPLDAADDDEESPPMYATAQEAKEDEKATRFLHQGLRPERRSDGQSGWNYRGESG